MQIPIESNFLDVNGVKIHYLKAGSGKPFVIFHAFFSDSVTFKGLIDYLSGNFTVYVPDFPGFGKSENLPGGSSFEKDNQAICEWIKLMNLNDFILAGFSLGGLNILQGIPLIDSKVKEYVLIEPYLGVKALRMDPKFLKNIQLASRLVKKTVPHSLGQKIWNSDSALKFIFATIDPLKHEKRPVEDKLRNLRTANYSTFVYYLDYIMHLENLTFNQKSAKKALIIMSRYDSTLFFPVTFEGYSKYFTSMKEIRVNLIDHYPTEPLTLAYFQKHFPNLLPEMIKLSRKRALKK